MEYMLRANNLNKAFGGIQALYDVNLDLRCGEIHCLVGENGAGKSTFGKIVAGIYTPDDGELIIEDKTYTSLTPAKAKELRIAMVTQELNLMPHLSIAENIFMFEKESYHGNVLLDRNYINRKAEELFQKFNLSNIPSVTTKVGNLTIAQQQMVEIVKAISQENNILILDEPTSTLSMNEVEQLFELIHKLKEDNCSILFVTHRLKEIFEIGDVVTVLCDGEIVDSGIPLDLITEAELVKLMVGRDIKNFFGEKEELELGDPVLELKNVGDGDFLEDISLIVREKEIVGLAGLVGAGRTEIVESIFGTRKVTSGEILFKGEDITEDTVKERIRKGVIFVPEDRKNKGLAVKLAIKGNINQVGMNLAERFIVHEGQYEIENWKMVRKLDIQLKSLEQKVNTLSGGNQQKVLLSKWLSHESSLIIFDEPTRGIDVGTKVEVYELIKSLAKEGKAIVMVSSELQELIAICDRILVVNGGRLVAEFDREEATEESILAEAIPV